MERKCDVRGCYDPPKVRGWCQRHYQVWRRHGDPTFRACKEVGCSMRVAAKNKCRKHWRRERDREKFGEWLSGNYVVQRSKGRCERCKHFEVFLLIPRVKYQEVLRTICASCSRLGDVKMGIIRKHQVSPKTYRDWYGIYNYDEEGRLLKWNRSTSSLGLGRS